MHYLFILGRTGGPRKLVYQGPEERFIDTDPALLPYTQYEYMVIAYNNEGQVSSEWESIRTMEAPPIGVPAPTVKVGKTIYQCIHVFYYFYVEGVQLCIY